MIRYVYIYRWGGKGAELVGDCSVDASAGGCAFSSVGRVCARVTVRVCLWARYIYIYIYHEYMYIWTALGACLRFPDLVGQ
jgi:hypothetical protein